MSSSNTKSVSSSITSSTLPSVRSACKACHERKIRCIIPPNGGPCHVCQSAGRSCYFLPRYKSGRPRRESSSVKSNGTTTATMPAPEAITETDVDDTAQTTPSGESWGSPVPTDHTDVPLPLPGALSTSTVPNPDSAPAADSFSMPSGPAFNFSDVDIGSFPNFGFCGFAGLAQGVKGSESALSYVGLPMSNWEAAVATSSNSRLDDNADLGSFLVDEHEGGVDRFGDLLKHVTKLNWHLEQTLASRAPSSRDGNANNPTPTTIAISSEQFQEMLQDVDTSCDAIFSIYNANSTLTLTDNMSKGDMDWASVSLTMAIILKVFAVCHALFDGKVLNNHSLNNVLLHKKLDFNMTQARIVMSYIEQLTQGGLLLSQETSRKAAFVEKRLKSIGNEDVMETSWLGCGFLGSIG